MNIRRPITKIIIHCSNSDNDEPIEVIREWHLKRGWDDIGYHYYIRNDGSLYHGRALRTQGAHCLGYNRESVGICLAGRRVFTDPQFQACRDLLRNLSFAFGLKSEDVYPHFIFNPSKTCPNFDWNYFKTFIGEIDAYTNRHLQ